MSNGCVSYLLPKGKISFFRHPGEMGISEVNQILTYLAVDRKVAASRKTRL